MIFATSENGVIGKDNKLLWHLPNDLKRFKKLTENRIVIMGKNTFLSLPDGALPNRINIVICNDDPEFLITETEIKPNTEVIKLPTIELALIYLKAYEQNNIQNVKLDEVFIIGGGAIYKAFLEYVDTLYITTVHTKLDGDTYAPDYNIYQWEVVDNEEHKKDKKHKYDYTFTTLKKIIQ